MKKIVVLLCLVGILLLSLALRVYRVSSDPPALNWDETSIAYNAYSILKTGKDEWGVKFPLHFESYGEYKLPAQIYASIPGIAIFGLNEFGVRITPVVYGVLTVLLLFLLTRQLTKNDSVSLVAALLLAISPWHIQLTRASFESSFSVFWVVMGLWLLVKGFEKPRYWIVSAIPFAIAVYTYNSARIITPILLFVILIMYWRKFFEAKKEAIIAAVIFAVMMFPLIPFILNGGAGARYKLVSVTDEKGLIPRIEQQRNLSTLPPLITKLVYNRVTYISYYIGRNYLAHFTPDFLFVHGAIHKQQHVQEVGEMYWWQAPFVLFGLYLLFKKKNLYGGLIIVWILITFIPVSVTQDSIPNALRTVLAAPPYAILSALGLVGVGEWIKNKNKKLVYLSSVILACIVAVTFSLYLNNYYNKYPVLYSRDWQYGYKQVVGFIKEHYSQYDQIVFTRSYGEPHMFTLFYLNWNPASYQTDPNLVRYSSYDWVWVTNFDKFYFPDLGDNGTKYEDIIKTSKFKRILFIGKPGDFPDSKPLLYKVDFLNGERAFDLVEEIKK